MTHDGRTCHPTWFDRRETNLEVRRQSLRRPKQYKPRLRDSLSALSPPAPLLFFIHYCEDRVQEFQQDLLDTLLISRHTRQHFDL